jgi:hypothetical protein
LVVGETSTEGLEKIDKSKNKIGVYDITKNAKINRRGWSEVNGIETQYGEQGQKKLQIRLQ